jgi:hypothetical protein
MRCAFTVSGKVRSSHGEHTHRHTPNARSGIGHAETHMWAARGAGYLKTHSRQCARARERADGTRERTRESVSTEEHTQSHTPEERRDENGATGDHMACVPRRRAGAQRDREPPLLARRTARARIKARPIHGAVSCCTGLCTSSPQSLSHLETHTHRLAPPARATRGDKPRPPSGRADRGECHPMRRPP